MTTVYDKIEMRAIERNLIDGSTSQAQFVKLAEELGEVAARRLLHITTNTERLAGKRLTLR